MNTIETLLAACIVWAALLLAACGGEGGYAGVDGESGGDCVQNVNGDGSPTQFCDSDGNRNDSEGDNTTTEEQPT